VPRRFTPRHRLIHAGAPACTKVKVFRPLPRCFGAVAPRFLLLLQNVHRKNIINT